MIRALAVIAALSALTACTDDDPCAGATTCIHVDVHSATVPAIDQLELDVVYGDLHATTTTQAGGGHTTHLPLATAVVLDLPGTDAIPVSIVAAGKLGATVLGAGAGSTTITPHHRATLDLELAPIEACTAGAFYCGGDKLAGDPQTLYVCTAGAGTSPTVCANGCLIRPAATDVCR